MSFIKIENLVCKKQGKLILDNINLDINKGGFYTILGPNGGGKSTLISHIVKATSVQSGSIFLNGKNIKSIKAKELAKRIAYVPQNTNMSIQFTNYDVVMMGRAHSLSALGSETNNDKEIVFEAMKQTDTLKLKDKLISQISGGERQRVLLARAIAQGAECLILDEPVAHLDINHSINLLNILKRLNIDEGKTIISVMHDINLSLNYGKECILIKDGKVINSGEINNVLNEQSIYEMYGVKMKKVYDENNIYMMPIIN